MLQYGKNDEVCSVCLGREILIRDALSELAELAKLQRETGWQPIMSFIESLKTILKSVEEKHHG